VRVTRPGNDPHRPRGGRTNDSRAPRLQQPLDSRGRPLPSVGRSTLWDDDPESGRPGPQPLKASWDPVERVPRVPTRVRPARSDRRRSAVGWFVHRYGWRAYAIPVLIALTVLVIIQVGRPPVSTAAASSGAASSAPIVVSGATTTQPVTVTPTTAPNAVAPASAPALGGAATAKTSPSPLATSSGSQGPIPAGTYDLPAAALPPGATFVAKGKNTWHLVKGTTAPMGSGPAKFTYSIEVEDGIQDAQSDQDFAKAVDHTLADPRSWIGSGKYTLQRVDTGNPSFTVSLTSQLTVREDALCGWQIQFEASCYARDVRRVAINDARWARGSVSANGDLGLYRVYAINHEVGHALGYVHQPCATNGGLAPVMMQQSWSDANNDLAPLNPQLIPMDGKVCKFNPFPYPLASAATSTGPAVPTNGTSAAG
jgi:hypothetical protein